MQVVKHWFRNTLFKERQRNKDSPYNFNNPPSTTLNLEEYERTGQAKVTALAGELNFGSGNNGNGQQNQNFQQNHNNGTQNDNRPHSLPSSIASNDRSDYSHQIKSEPNEDNMSSGLLMDETSFHQHNLALAAAVAAQQRQMQQQSQQQQQQQSKNAVDHHHQQNMLMDHDSSNLHNHHHMYYNNFETKSESGSSEILSRPPTPSSSYSNINDIINQQIESIPINNIANISGGGGSQNDASGASTSTMGPPKKLQLNKMFEKNFDANSNSSNSSTSSGKRANRTRFTDYQIKVLQEFFENNSYPKDSDLEYLSKLLYLSPRVIVVWFQVSCILC